MMYLIMYIKYTHQLRSTFNCYFPYVKGHFWQGNRLLLSIFLIISSTMFIFVCSNLIESNHRAQCGDVFHKDIGRNAVKTVELHNFFLYFKNLIICCQNIYNESNFIRVEK